MDFGGMPIGFSMALAQDQAALEKYGLLTPPEKQAILAQAHSARSEEEMHKIVQTLSGRTLI